MHGDARWRRPNAREVKLKYIWDSYPIRTKKKNIKKKQRNLLDELLGYVAYLISSYIGYIETQIKRDEHIFYHASLWEEFETRLWSYASDKNIVVEFGVVVFWSHVLTKISHSYKNKKR